MEDKVQVAEHCIDVLEDCKVYWDVHYTSSPTSGNLLVVRDVNPVSHQCTYSSKANSGLGNPTRYNPSSPYRASSFVWLLYFDDSWRQL